MDSVWFNQATRGYDHHQSNTENNVDLTLKLGLPIDHDHDQPQFEPYFRSTSVLKTHQPPIFLNFSAPFTQGTNHYEMANGGESTGLNHHGVLSHGGEAGMNSYGMPIGGNLQDSWPQEMGNHPIYMNNGTDSVMGFPAYPNSYISFNSNPGNGPVALLNMLPRNVDHGENGGSSGSHRRSSHRQREDSHIDSNKRCSNRSCKTKDTPMWRKGPLGPKTLCNACGIKYRKEEEKRRAREAAKKNSDNKDGQRSS